MLSTATNLCLIQKCRIQRMSSSRRWRVPDIAFIYVHMWAPCQHQFFFRLFYRLFFIFFKKSNFFLFFIQFFKTVENSFCWKQKSKDCKRKEWKISVYFLNSKRTNNWLIKVSSCYCVSKIDKRRKMIYHVDVLCRNRKPSDHASKLVKIDLHFKIIITLCNGLRSILNNNFFIIAIHVILWV